MGGPMKVYEEEEYSWLSEEKRSLKSAIDSGKKFLESVWGHNVLHRFWVQM
jgi:GMP synthase-like glutamine amidotransferase